MTSPRYASKFTNTAGTIELVFPANRLEYEETQALRSPAAAIAGAHYPLRLLGTGLPLKEAKQVRLRFIFTDTTETAIDTTIDNLKEEILGVGFGKIWTTGADGSLRWAYAEAIEAPSILISAGRNRVIPSSIGFKVWSDWFDDTLTEEGEAINADPDTIVITNAGNAPVKDAIITIKGTFTNPNITNNTNGYSFSSTRDGTLAAHWLKIDCGRRTVEFSTDSGVTYADDITLFTRGATQVGFMTLNVGDNTFEITGCNGATIDVDFYPAYH